MRLFVALDIEEVIRQQIAGFSESLHESAPDARWVEPESYHLTLKFLGECNEDELDAYRRALSDLRHPRVALTFRGTGFFPNARSARAFWVGVEGEGLPELASAVDDALAAAGATREERRFSPHLTLARAPAGRGERPFARLQERLARIPQPSFGTMTAGEFFLYQSRTAPQGAVYTRLERFPLE